jgi:DNA polymerase
LDPTKIGSPDEKHFNPDAWEMGLKAVTGYRDKYDRIKSFWKTIENTAKEAIKNPNVVYRVREKLFFKFDGHVLRMMLPSNRVISYPKARLEQVVKFDRIGTQVVYQAVTEKGLVVDEYMYGGKFTENAVQGIARDLMCTGLWHSAKAGFENIGTVHDEIIALYKDVRNWDRLQHKYEKLICRLPDWADSENLEYKVPLMAEGKVGYRYGK